MTVESNNSAAAGESAGRMRRPDVVPYIGTWKAEQRTGLPVLETFGRGIAFADEEAEDRDARGVLWARVGAGQGQGRPVYDRVHARRQRWVMENLLCQVCAGPASRTDEGWLWLLHDDRGVEPRGWPEQVAATHPPVCVPCARVSVRLCPHLSEGAVAVRVRNPRLWGVYGVLHAPSRRGLARTAGVMVGYHDPLARWVLAAQMVRLLRGCTVVELGDLL